ncbi:protein SAND-like [Clavelina lepadiformis]|uniref:Vacuolar fusion protein MON1 homolog n=1 Tax=Clavelina lepadiformis TaxID=159417 RepID=A0ABP0GCY1_CLALP
MEDDATILSTGHVTSSESVDVPSDFENLASSNSQNSASNPANPDIQEEVFVSADDQYVSDSALSLPGPSSDDDISFRQRKLTMLMTEEDESELSSSWKEKKSHIFVLTEAGKPVYSRHGCEDKLSSLMGVMVAIVSCVHDRNDTIRSIVAGNRKFVFLIKLPLVLVAVSSALETIHQIEIHLHYVYNTIISVVSLSQLNRIYSTQKNYDLRRLLTGTDKFLDHLCNSMDQDPQYLLRAVKCLPLAGHMRDFVGQSLQQSKTDDLAFAVLVSSGQVVSICRLKEHNLDTTDLQVLLNLVNASATSFHAGESWLPICLAQFNPSGFLHAHISFLDEKLQTCLIFLSADRDAFFTLCECKKKVVAKLNKHKCLEAIHLAYSKADYTVSKVGIPELWHFLYKTNNISQFTCPEFSVPYHNEKQRQRLFGLYQEMHGKIHNPAAPLKLHYSVSDEETLLAWVASGFELYATFSPLVTKNQAISAVDRLLRWIKHREDELFMMRTLTF